ncbi:MAG: peptidase S8 family protein, partial [Pseudomonadota bacterium]
MTRFTLDHIDISALSQPRSYKSPSSNPRSQRTQRIREEHGPRLIDEYASAFDAALADRPKGEDGQPEPDGVVLEVELAPRAPVTDLSRIRENTRQGTTRIDPVTGAQKIALIVPDEKRGVMEALIDEYAHGPLIRRDN